MENYMFKYGIPPQSLSVNMLELDILKENYICSYFLLNKCSAAIG
jgi:hypothetical protein